MYFKGLGYNPAEIVILYICNYNGYMAPANAMNIVYPSETAEMKNLRNIHNIYYKSGKLSLSDKSQASLFASGISSALIKSAGAAFVNLISQRVSQGTAAPYPTKFSIVNGKISVSVTTPSTKPPVEPVVTVNETIPPALPDVNIDTSPEPWNPTTDNELPPAQIIPSSGNLDFQSTLNKYLPYGVLLFGAVIALNLVSEKR